MADAFVVEALKVIVPPAAASTLGALVARWGPERLRPPVGALALALGFGAAHVAVAGWPGWPATETLHWLPWLGLLAVCAATFRSGRGVLPVALLLAAACTWAVLGRLASAPTWGDGERALLFGGSGAALLVLWWPAFVGGTRAETLPGALAVLAGGSSAAAMLSNSAKLSQLAGALAVGLACFALLMLLRPCSLLARGVSRVGCVLLGALLLYDQHFLGLPPLELGGLALGWLALHAGRAPAFQRWPLRRAVVVQALLVALPVLAAVALGIVRHRAEVAANPYY